MTSPAVVTADFKADGAELDGLLAGLTPEQWALPTPAPGWTITHQVAHLVSIFRLVVTATHEPAAFAATVARLGHDFEARVDAALRPYLEESPRRLRQRLTTEGTVAADALASCPADRMLPWLSRSLPAIRLAAAGIVELFAHGQDIADAVGVRPHRTDRIRHVVAVAVANWEAGYLARGQQPPAAPHRFDLVAPSGTRWQYGPADAEQVVSGPALDFCLLTTRRRHRAELALAATGADADHWLDIAQAYRGPAGEGRRPGQSTRAVGA
jgi:uncharacterized protein (TIGR03084 family)